MCIGLHVKYWSFLSECIDIFSENTYIYYLVKICPMGAEFYHANRQTDRWTDRHDRAIVVFCSFANALKKLGI
jgi:hypothetical protein